MSGPTAPKKSNLDGLTAFQWEVQPEAEKLVHELLSRLVRDFKELENFEKLLKERTGTRLLDWVERITIKGARNLKPRLRKAGFNYDEQVGGWKHPGGMFPIIEQDQIENTIWIKVDSIADFFAHWNIDDRYLSGKPYSQCRWAVAFKRFENLSRKGNCLVWVIERHGYNARNNTASQPSKNYKSIEMLELFRWRDRDFLTDEYGFEHAEELIKKSIRTLGRDWTCDLFFRAEREYWQIRNKAGQIQKARQDSLGLGWANHDHHTYRSSRHCFQHLIKLLELLGFNCRERFYAGHEAGWGAQVLEQPVTNICIFADVDMTPEEVKGDFAHKPFAEKKDLGTVGLWCALHGEAFLQAGMHHLECQFDFAELTKQLDPVGVKMMKPFTNFPYLRQAFTEGEIWPVKEERIQKLLKAKKITAEQAEKFRKEGALGSHLENLERNQGFKGFNQTGISEIISATDPRKQKSHA